MPVKICFCYAHDDEAFLILIKKYLKLLQKPGLIEEGQDRDINAGTEWKQEISEQLNTAQIILLLVSPDFLNSDYSYSIEMQQALMRHERGEARVIPVILRPVYWQGAPFAKLQVLPENAKPIIGSRWISEAFYQVVESILEAAEKLRVYHSASLYQLTAREREVLRLLTQGFSNLQIAQLLGLSPKTVSAHILRIYTKIGSRTHAEAIQYAIKHELI